VVVELLLLLEDDEEEGGGEEGAFEFEFGADDFDAASLLL